MSGESKRVSGIANSLRQLGGIQVNDWDFEGLLNKDVRDLEFTKSLRRLGSIRVMEWDFKDVLPAVNRLAQQEVDLVDLVKRLADYKVMEWDFRNDHSSGSRSAGNKRSAPGKPLLSHEEMQVLIVRLKDFLQCAIVNLIDEPKYAHVKVSEIAPNVLRFKLVLVKRDVSMLIGTGGHTAAAIRNLMKAVAGEKGVAVLLQILSHEEDALRDDDSSGEV
jgi:predicted RNA-binding protein YlqC (UPF0109 family)